jgi:4-methyl-5(b-hydroxyethyl)-thiazole monophosphate biosynthesis
MDKHVVVLIADGFEDMETVAPIDILTRFGVGVNSIGINRTEVKGAYGTTLVTDTVLDDVADGSFDGVVLPGGVANARSLAADRRVIDLVERHHRAGKLVAAICASPGHVLAEGAGILRGRKATGHPAFRDKLAAGGAVITDQLVTADGNIITGIGPWAAPHFGLAVAKYFVGEESVNELAGAWGFEVPAVGPRHQ